MKDPNEWHIDELPPDSNMVIVAIRGLGGKITECLGYYTEAWGQWRKASDTTDTEIHVIGWAYLLKWVKPKQQGKDNEHT